MVIVAALLLVGITVFLILQPILAGSEARLESGTGDTSEAQFRKRVSLHQLRDVEYEFAMGKLSEDDFQILKKEISAEAVAAIREEELEARAGEASRQGSVDSGLEEEILKARARISGGVPCANCGKTNLDGSRFCAECGHPLQVPQPSEDS
jgi:cytochrome c-type biogenesis protein CcmI